MAVLHHPGAHVRRRSSVGVPAAVAFILGFALALPAALFVATDVLPPMLPLGEQVLLSGPTAQTMALVMASATGLAAAVCAAARRTRNRS